jgi:hypothetical protein
MVVAMLVMIAGITLTINASNVICCTADILRFKKTWRPPLRPLWLQM